MKYCLLFYISTMLFMSCHSPKSQTPGKKKPSTPRAGTLTLQKPHWPNESLPKLQHSKHTPKWPEKMLKDAKLSSLKPLRVQTQRVKRRNPEWPERLYQQYYSETQDQNKKKIIRLRPPEPYDTLAVQPSGHHKQKSQRPNKMQSLKSQLVYFGAAAGFGSSMMDIIQTTVANIEMGIEAEAESPRVKRVIDATDADFVNFLMVQADDMVDAMKSLFATRRIPSYFTVHHTRCYGARTYCTEACKEVLRDICRKFKCSRQVKEYVTDQCVRCNLRFIREFPRKLLLNLDFLKAREIYSKVTNRTFESFFPPKYLKPFYSKNQPSPNRTADISYYSTSSEYYTSFESEETTTTTTTTTTEKTTTTEEPTTTSSSENTTTTTNDTTTTRHGDVPETSDVTTTPSP